MKLIYSIKGMGLCIALLVAGTFQSGCKISYSFSGASISPLAKSFNVQYFQNMASMVQPELSQMITDALIDQCKAQTNLKPTDDVADMTFEGTITGYNYKPMTISASDEAATNRFTISVKVKFTNAIEPDYSYEQTFSRYEDFDSSIDFSSVEGKLMESIVDMLVEDIFNKAFVNW